MKTTVEIPDSILEEARRLAAREETTVKALIEEGLRHVISNKSVEPQELRDASFKGKGLKEEFRDGGWSRIRDAAYEGRGS